MKRPGPDKGCHATEEELEEDNYSDSPNNSLYPSYIKLQGTHRVLTNQTNVMCQINLPRPLRPGAFTAPSGPPISLHCREEHE
jgi:hypothetical protein